ncbi:spinster family MFS transporter [Sphingomonas arenae]|uniref:spinster family MFS transporter n=1 Tax=Sphingomonas arenae TaxID=2812555 RepID=UPI001968A2D6|nr:MFS transporter [Sphingomonas arenae]
MTQEAPRALPRNPNLVLAFLLLAYILNFLDRQILGILAQPIKADLQLTDTQFGAIGGLAFALLYSVLGVPLSYLADRTSRSAVVAGSLAVWSGFTALCGTAGSYMQLFLYRLGVGIGEAGGVAPSYALIADYFPPHRRARALGVYSLGVPLGLGGGTLAGAYIAELINWRAAFLIMGVLGLILAPIFLWVVRDVPRPKVAAADRMPFGSVFKVLARKPSFWLLAFAASCSSLVGYGLALWTPSVLMLSFGMNIIGAGQFMGSLLLVGGTAGVLAGGFLADRLGHANQRWYAWLPAIAWLITLPFFLFGLMSDSLALAWPLLLVPNALNILWLGPVATAVQNLVERPMRATASACFLLINNLVGLGVGPLLIGAVSDALKTSYGVESLRYAAVAALGFYLVAALLALLASRTLIKDWVADEPA